MNDPWKDTNRPKSDEPRPIEADPARVRRGVVLRVLGFFLLIALLLGLAIWFVIRQEEKLESSIETNATLLDVTSGVLRVDTGSLTIDYQPPLTVGIEPETTPPAETGGGLTLDRESMARATELVRDAALLLEQAQLDDAEALTVEALDLRPGMNAAERLLGLIYLRRGQFDQSAALFEGVLKRNPFDPETLNNLATVYMQTKQLDRAEELLLTAAGMESRRVAAPINLGMLYLLQGRYDKATDNFERALDLDPSLTQVRNNLAVALIRQGYFEEARLHLERVIEDEPRQGGAYFNIAIAYGLEGQADKAMAWIARGAETCSPSATRKFLSDPDFDNLRETPAFKAFLNTLVPDAPTLPQP